MTDAIFLLPLLFHCESGRKALAEKTEPGAPPVMTYWMRWSNIYVEVDSPLLDYKPDGRRLD